MDQLARTRGTRFGSVYLSATRKPAGFRLRTDSETAGQHAQARWVPDKIQIKTLFLLDKIYSS
jgi:hypothetical protein